MQNKRYRVGLFADVTNNYYFRNVIRGITECVRIHDEWEVIGDQVSDLDGKAVLGGAVDGVLVDFAKREHLVPYFERAQVPIVNISTRAEAIGPFAQVRPDHVEVGRVVADHFLHRGFRRFGYYGPSDLGFSNDRAAGFGSRLNEFGYECDADRRLPWARTGRTVELKALTAWAARLPPSTAIMAATDVFGWHVLTAAQQAGRRVPEDLVVCGVDNDESLCELIAPSLTSVPLDGRRAGRVAAELLGQLMVGDQSRDCDTIVIPPLTTVTRRSTDILAVNDVDVAEALRQIRDDAAAPGGLTAAAVAHAANISRSLLERRFRVAVGRTIQQEIWRVQMAKARDLLRDTDLPMPAIAKACGFSSAVRFSEAFRRLDGRPPSMFRAETRATQKTRSKSPDPVCDSE